MTTGLTLRHCSGCHDERLFERPPCFDGHGGDCPEWICTDCGAAITIGHAVTDPAVIEADAA